MATLAVLNTTGRPYASPKSERRYVAHPGLNLSYEVREGIVKHQARAGTSVPVLAGRGAAA